jgi:uncharacterized protein (TIGR00369 family)
MPERSEGLLDDLEVERSVLGSLEAVLPRVARRLAATRRLVGTTRRLMQVVATTAGSVPELEAAERALSEVAARLESRVRDRPLRVQLDEPALARLRAGEAWDNFAYNPLGIPLSMRFDEDGVRATLPLEPLHEGPPGLLHGGFSAALMDALLGTLVAVQGHEALTASLEVRFRRSVSVDETVELGGRIDKVDGRKIEVVGWIDHERHRCVDARALFVVMPGTWAADPEGRGEQAVTTPAASPAATQPQEGACRC